MKIFNSFEEICKELTKVLKDDNGFVIGIDGKDGSGKSYLARELSETLSIEYLSLDNYLNENNNNYTEHLDIKSIQEDLKIKNKPLIIEGVCLLAVTKKAGITLDKLIYIKRVNSSGVWLDKKECQFEKKPNELILELEHDLKQFVKFEEWMGWSDNNDGKEVQLPELVKELVYYHSEFSPCIKANYIYERAEA